MIDHAQQAIVKELRMLLEKDIKERVLGPELRVFMSMMKSKSGDEVTDAVEKPAALEKRGLKGLSFKKANSVKEAIPLMSTMTLRNICTLT